MMLTQVQLDNGQTALKLYLPDMKRKTLNFLQGSVIRSVEDSNIHNIIIQFNDPYPFLTPYAKTILLKTFVALGIQDKTIHLALVTNNRLLTIALKSLIQLRSKDTKSLSFHLDLFPNEATAISWLNIRNGNDSARMTQ